MAEEIEIFKTGFELSPQLDDVPLKKKARVDEP